MSIRLMSKVFRESQTRGNARLILLALADSASEQGYCFPSLREISDKAKLSEKVTRIYLSAFEKIGIVGRMKRESDSGRTTSNAYQFNEEKIGHDAISAKLLEALRPASWRGRGLPINPLGVGVAQATGGGGCSGNRGVGVAQATPSYTLNRQKESSGEPSEVPFAEILRSFIPLKELNGFKEVWSEFIADRAERKKKVTSRAAKMILKRCAERPAMAIQALEECIEKGWASFKWHYFDKPKPNGARSEYAPIPPVREKRAILATGPEPEPEPELL